jgi:tetratricopeptide (TPR) repeat protein
MAVPGSATAEQACRERGNDLFRQGQHAAAAAAYTQGLTAGGTHTPSSAAARAVLLSNRAACHLALQDAAAAEQDCRQGLVLDPINAKLYYRLAQALVTQGAAAKAATHMAAAVALMGPAAAAQSPALCDLYSRIQQAAAAAAGVEGAASVLQEAEQQQPGAAAGEERLNPIAGAPSGSPGLPDAAIHLPADMHKIKGVSVSSSLYAGFRSGTQVVVVAPGTYTLPHCLDVEGRCSLLGVGAVVIKSQR